MNWNRQPLVAPEKPMAQACRPDILLAPNIPKPLHGTAPRTVLGDDWWQVVRKQAYASTNRHCLACGVFSQDAKFHKWLEAHELYDYDWPVGRLVFKEVVPLCHACHNYIHSGRMTALVDKGEMTQAKHKEILKHGKSVLKAAGLPARLKNPSVVAPWGKWRLVINGTEYKGKFKTFADWCKEYHPDAASQRLDFMDIFEEEHFLS